MKNKLDFILSTLIILFLFSSNNAFAQLNISINGSGIGSAMPKIDGMFASFASSAESLIRLVRVVGYVIGIALVIGSIFKFAQLGEQQGQVKLKMPISMFLIGVIIFSSTSMLAVLTQTMALSSSGPGDILSPAMAGAGNFTAEGMRGILLVIRLVGFIGFIKGWLMLNDIAQGKQGSNGTAWTHILGGVAAININAFAQILANTFVPGMGLHF